MLEIRFIKTEQDRGTGIHTMHALHCLPLEMQHPLIIVKNATAPNADNNHPALQQR